MITRLVWAIVGMSWLCGCQGVPDRRPLLIVASDLNNMPFAGVDAHGHPVGRDVEMMQILTDRCGYRLQWSRMPFDQLLPQVVDGRVDAVCATLGITAERAQRVLFSPPYFDTAIAVVVRVGRDEPATLAALAGKRVSAAAGTTSERAVRDRLAGARGVFENKAGASALYRLLAGEVDGAVMDGPAADKLVADSTGKLRRLREPLARERYALAFPKTHSEVAARLGQALAELRASGGLADLDRRYGLRGN